MIFGRHSRRARDFPLSRLQSRLRCPQCRSRRVVVMFEPPRQERHPSAAELASNVVRCSIRNMERTGCTRVPFANVSWTGSQPGEVASSDFTAMSFVLRTRTSGSPEHQASQNTRTTSRVRDHNLVRTEPPAFDAPAFPGGSIQLRHDECPVWIDTRRSYARRHIRYIPYSQFSFLHES
jgi:hypothetical protein